MKRGGMPPPVPQRAADPRIREDQGLQEFHSNSDKMHRATFDDAYTQAWFDFCRSSIPQSVRKQVQTLNFSCANVPVWYSLQQHGFLQPEDRIPEPENLNKPVTKGEKFNVANLSLLREV